MPLNEALDVMEIAVGNFIVQLITSATVSAILAGALVWLTKSWISERLKTAIKHEYDEKLETHKFQLKAESDVEIERLRSQLSMATMEHQVKYSKLHEQRAEVIATLYQLLVQAYWDGSSFVSLTEWNGEPNKEEKYRLAMNSFAELYRFFDKNRIYLPAQLCDGLDEFVREMRKIVIGFGVYVDKAEERLPDHMLEKKHQVWTSSWEYFEKQVPVARETLESELRQLLGGSE